MFLSDSRSLSLLIARASGKLTLDFYMIGLFLRCFNEFVQTKAKLQGKLTPYNLRVIVLTRAILVQVFLSVLISAFCYTMYHISYFEDMPTFLLVLKVLVQPVAYTP